MQKRNNLRANRYETGYSLKKILYKHKIGRRMKEVTKKLDGIAGERVKFHFREITLVERQNRVAAIRETGSFLSEPYLVYGRDEEKEKIVDILVNQVRGSDELSILPIVGIGGLGKTTFARLVFNDERVGEHFDVKLWVCVSDNFDMKNLIKAMIESATGSASASSLNHLDTLQQRISHILKKKRYLLVLDDVWNEDQEKWYELKNVLACGLSGSSVILTTRLKKVANMMSILPIHYLKGLPEEDCLLLFKQRAFGEENEKYHKLHVIGKKIVKKCAGVPLAAKSLGSLLRFKRDEKEWLHVEESELWNLPQEETAILPALKISYRHLPFEYRRCFAYCAIFPKDSVIKKQEVIFLWMAHGYISSNGNLEVEDVGNEIWNELVLRSLFENVCTDEGKTTFQMHDLVHDLAKSIMENKIPGVPAESNNTNSKIREVNLRKKCVAFPTSVLPEMDLSFALMNFRYLRMLNASKRSVNHLPSAIGNLKHLRYLNLSNSNICTLPNTICSLWNLKILKLNGCEKLQCLPKNMRFMRNLRHLFLKKCSSLSQMPSNVGELTSLETLSLFIVGEVKGYQLDELQSLNLGAKLDIKRLERVKDCVNAKKANLAEKRNLRDLGLQWDVASKLGEDVDDKILEVLEPHPSIETLRIDGFRGKYFPLWMRFSTLANIIRINIWNCPNLLCLPEVLGELPFLKYLELKNLSVKYIIEEEVKGDNLLKPKFPSLEHLILQDLTYFNGLLKEEAGEMFRNLQKLYIVRCPSLILPQLPSLQKIHCSTVNLSSFFNLDNLRSLKLEIDNSCKQVPYETLEKLADLESLCILELHEHSVPEKGFGFLKSLRRLEIVGSKTLTCLPEGWLLHLSALEFLYIGECPEFVEIPKGIKYLHNLRSLTLYNLPKMTCLPESLKHLPSLGDLGLAYLPLTSLPDWLSNLTSLQSLYVDDCSKLASFPESIQEMKNLKFLTVKNCPKLEMQCEKANGGEWHKIAHIPALNIGDN